MRPGLQTARHPTISNPGGQFWLRKSDAVFANARSRASKAEQLRRSLGTGLEEIGGLVERNGLVQVG